MSRRLFSAQWYRVAGLRPRLRSHAEIHRNVFRDEVWFVVEDHATGAFQRISQAAYRLVGLMNGARTVDQIWRAAGEQLGDDLPTQDETIQLLVRLHQADLLHADIPPDMTRVVRRGEKKELRRRAGSIRNPLAIRIPLFDPDEFIRSTLWLVRPLIGWAGLALWAAVVAAGILTAAIHWEALSSNIADRALTAGNLLLLVAIYPFVKALHELGHAYAVRRWGGEVHEIGVMLLVFMPVPYVDASASSAFRSKWRRAAVAFAGIAVELFLAAGAAILWAGLEPGLFRAAMMNVMILCGVSTVLFNGNPLLRFDGYYALSDVVEIPNLGSRSNQHLLAAVQRYVLGMRDAVFPAMARGEAAWFTVYGVAALVYRYMIMATIALFVAGRFFEIGLVLALWTLVLLIAVPAAKGVWFVLSSPRLDGRRSRALLAAGTGVAAVGWLLFLQPVPQATVVTGVVVTPEHTVANARAEGFVSELLAPPGQVVIAGTPILRIEDTLLDARVALLESQIAELDLRRLRSVGRDPVATALVSEERALAEEELALARERRGERILRAGNDGRLLLPSGDEMLGRFVRRGDTLAWVVGPGDAYVKAVVSQRDIDFVRRSIEGVAIRRSSGPDRVWPARVVGEDAAATTRIPSPALGQPAGGPIPLDPTSGDRVTALETVFVIDLAPDDPGALDQIGERVHVRFDHGAAPLGRQLWRSLRQVFLRDLNV